MTERRPATGTRPRIGAIFQGRVARRDPPGMKRRAHLFQQPSDRLRGKAKEFAELIIGLVPDERWHDDVVVTLKGLVERGESALLSHLNAAPEHGGYVFEATPPPDDPAKPEPKTRKRQEPSD